MWRRRGGGFIPSARELIRPARRVSGVQRLGGRGYQVFPMRDGVMTVDGIDMQVVWSQPRAHQAVRYPTGVGDDRHGYGHGDAEFLLKIARWIVTSGGECTLRYLGEEPYPDDPVDSEPRIELVIPIEQDTEEDPCEVALEPGWWVIHFGYGNFAFLDPESFDHQFSLDAPAYVGTIQDGLTDAVQMTRPFDSGEAVDRERGAPYLQDVPLHVGDTVGVEVDGEVHLTTFDPAAAVDSDRGDPSRVWNEAAELPIPLTPPEDPHGWTPGGDQ